MIRPALQVSGLGRAFRPHRDRATTFRGYVEGGWRRRPDPEPFWALRDITFDVAPGEMLGVVGHNGSGKSTLLRILGGVMPPTEGQMIAAAPVNGLLDLNSGMHQDLSGRENILIAGVLAGLGRAEVRARFDEIVEFAEVARFIDEPLRAYSAGMRLRLGFAVAIHVRPQILLIDEVLTVGDLGFQRKCLDRIATFRRDGCAIVLISHDMHQVEATCDRALWLHRGRMRALDVPGAVIARYQAAMLAPREGSASTVAGDPDLTYQGRRLVVGQNRYGCGPAQLQDVRLTGVEGETLGQLATGAPLTIAARIVAPGGLPPSHFSVTISASNGTACFDTNTDNDGTHLPALESGAEIALHLDRLDLLPGVYMVSVGLWMAGWEHAYDYHSVAYELEIMGKTGQKGLLAVPHHWQIEAD